MIREQVIKTIDRKGLISRGDKVLVCVSGGPDSIALLHLLLGLQKYYDIELAVAHLDHMLRGKASSADANFVKNTAAKLRIPCIVEKRNVKRIEKSRKQSLEETAREVRYDFFERAAGKAGANKIATAHTMDDQAETVLMRFIKGSGSRGLSGIPYRRRLGKLWVIRPLLDIKRADIEKYLRGRKLSSRIDASNFKTLYLRNRIRHVLIPSLEKGFNPNIKENLKSIAKNLGDEFDYLNTVAGRLYKRLVSEQGASIEVGIPGLLRQHIALQRLLVRQIISSIKGDLKKITYRHWQEIEEILHNNKPSADLPGKIKVARRHNRLVFKIGCAPKKRQPYLKRSAKLNIPGEAIVPGLGIKLNSEIIKSTPALKRGKKRRRVEYINGDSITHPLKIRTRRKGDRIRPLGMVPSKKLHDVFIDEKIPREMRGSVPLVVSGNRILWVVGVKLSEDCRIKADTERIVKLSVAPLPKK